MAIKADVQALVTKGAVTMAYPNMKQCTSTLLVVPKTDESLCPVIMQGPSISLGKSMLQDGRSEGTVERNRLDVLSGLNTFSGHG